MQEKFNNLIQLLESIDSKNPLLKECITQKLEELSFSYFSDETYKVGREHIFKIYKIRSTVLPHDKGKEPYIIGYNQLLPKLENSELPYCNVNSLSTQLGTYIIFSDYEYKHYFGILKSKQTLNELRDIMKNSPYYQEKTFINGKIVN